MRQDLCRLGVQQESKGVTVRQALASFRSRAVSFLGSTLVVLTALAIGLVGSRRGVGGKLEIFGDRHRRQYRQDAVFGQCRRGALSGLADQDDDALPGLRGARLRQDQEVDAGAVLRACRRAAADQARRQGRRIGQRRDASSIRWSPNRPTISAAAIAEYLGGSEDGFARMMTAKATQARHDRHAVPERVRPARPRPAFDGARPRHPRPGAARAFPAILQLFLDALLHLWPPAHGQPQPPARPRQGHRRHQDRLHPRLRLQPRHRRSATASAASSPS